MAMFLFSSSFFFLSASAFCLASSAAAVSAFFRSSSAIFSSSRLNAASFFLICASEGLSFFPYVVCNRTKIRSLRISHCLEEMLQHLINLLLNIRLRLDLTFSRFWFSLIVLGDLLPDRLRERGLSAYADGMSIFLRCSLDSRAKESRLSREKGDLPWPGMDLESSDRWKGSRMSRGKLSRGWL